MHEPCSNFNPSDQNKFFTKPLVIIFITVFIDLVGFGIVIPLLPYYGETFNASPFEVGMLFAIYSAMQFIFAPILGVLSDYYGRRPILFWSLIGSGLGYLCIGYASALWMVFVGRIVAGITGGNLSTAQACIADLTTKENRARGMGTFGAMFGFGFIFGPAIGGILSRYGVQVPFLFASVLIFANAIAFYFVFPETVKKRKNTLLKKSTYFTKPGVKLASIFSNSRFSTINILYFLVITAFSIMTASFTLFTIYRFKYNAEQNGYLFAYIGVSAIIFQGLLFSRLAKRFSEDWLVVFGCFLMVGSLFTLPYIGPNLGGLSALLVSMTFFSLGNSLSSPSLTSLASKISDEKNQGKVFGVMQSAASLARAVGPTIASFLLNNAVNKIDDFTILRTFWVASAVMFASFLVAIYLVKTRQKHTFV